jgi:hypothetical protein
VTHRQSWLTAPSADTVTNQIKRLKRQLDCQFL